MANVFLYTTLCLFLLTTTFFIANSARILDEFDSQPQAIGNLPGPGTGAAAATPSGVGAGAGTGAGAVIFSGAGAAIPSATAIPQAGPITASPSGITPAASNTNTVTPGSGEVDPNADPSENELAPAEDIAPVGSPAIDETPEAEAPLPASPNVVTPVVTAKPVAKEPTLSFYMHDILGGSHPSARVVAGIVANTDVTGLPFSKLNNNLFPITGGIPLVNPKLNGIVTSNNLPNLVGLNAAQSSTVFKNSGTSNTVSGGNNQPFVSAGNLPGGFTIQKLMFGSATVIDDQLTEEHELDSSVIGRAQGFYLASSLDGTSKTIVLTILVHGEEHHDGVDDTISLFGIHRTASLESEVAVIGGTGKFENAKGYAAVETLLKEDQHTTDGADTILHFNIYLTE
ncbi:dirigent protein 9-like [Vicia villosa]|uniref:dirigent protein 9-like n=1 Tax=Vicia villosa TaxID=3911 RepID=UPI00273CD8FA|nr:dirigent protein 9-like [Vicia villosa]